MMYYAKFSYRNDTRMIFSAGVLSDKTIKVCRLSHGEKHSNASDYIGFDNDS